MKIHVRLRTIRIVTGLLIVILLAGGVGYWLGERGSRLEVANGGLRVVNATVPTDKSEVDFSLFWEVWDELERSYLDPSVIDRREMVYGAIRGMTAALEDPYTVFLSPTDNDRAKSDLNGQFEGVGIQLGYVDSQLAVIAPLKGTPADKAGVQPQDLILNIRDDRKDVDTDTQGMSLQEAVTLIRGERGTPVTLTLWREGLGAPFEQEIFRATITVPSVEIEIGRWGDEGWEEDVAGPVAWIQVHRFGEQTVPQWNEAVASVLSNPSVQGVVLDVRNNPGGFLNGAVTLASEFIADGEVVRQDGRLEDQVYTATGEGRLIGMPVVVVINGGSASASEILAGALRDRVGAVLVGEKSFGKGTVQDAIDLRGEAGLHVTVGSWLLPGGESIAKEGLVPEYVVEREETDVSTEEEDSEEPADEQLRRAIEVLLAR